MLPDHSGVEAIRNGVPSFEKPKARNAATTLTLMGAIAVVLFGGITVLAVALNARALPDGTCAETGNAAPSRSGSPPSRPHTNATQPEQPTSAASIPGR